MNKEIPPYINYIFYFQWDLTCDRKWIGTFIFSLLLIGCSIGAVISGQVADKIGRKPVYCSSVLLLILFNVLSATSTSWVMYAALQFVIGVLIEANLNVGMSLCVENTPKSWRALAVMVPSWPLVASLFALAAWCLHDWRKLHLLSAVIGIPFLVSWWYIYCYFKSPNLCEILHACKTLNKINYM